MMTEITLHDGDDVTASSPDEVNDGNINDTNWRARTAAALYRRRRYLEAQQRARQRQMAQTQALAEQQEQQRKDPKSRFRDRLAAVGNVLQKMNVGRWIDDLERDQELADELDRVNQSTREEAERLAICREAHAACIDAMREHLLSFVGEHGYDETQEGAAYEDWIRDLHPDNVEEETCSPSRQQQSSSSLPPVDKRFFIPDCDHYVMWKQIHDKANTKTGETHDNSEEGMVEEDLSEISVDKKDG